MMKRMVKRKISKISKISSMISLIALAAMFIVFFLSIPQFVTTMMGRIFVGIWASMAILSFIAHGKNKDTQEERQYVPVFGVKKVERTFKARPKRFMRGI